MTPEAADRAVGALCSMLALDPPDRARLTSLFEDRAHEELHVIAAATQERDRAAAGRLLVAKERVESDLAQAEPPPSTPDDARTLLQRTREALVAIGLRAPACAGDEGSSPAAD